LRTRAANRQRAWNAQLLEPREPDE
jgi:hypothetical protein